MNTLQSHVSGDLRWRRVIVLLSGLLSLLVDARAGTDVTQSWNLRAGWNAIWMEVSPANDAPDAVFAGLPVESVWTFRDRLPAVDFIQDESEPVWNRDRWLVWSPPARPESLANSLFAIPGHRAYLVKLTATATWTVKGRPALRPAAWRPDAYNLKGFPIDPGLPPTFYDFFSPSAAHFDATANTLQPMYRLNASGAWTRVSPSDAMQRGEAYWVFSKGGSDYVAPLEVRLENGGEDLSYGRQISEFRLNFKNRQAAWVDLSVGENPSTPLKALAYGAVSPTEGTVWTPLPTLWTETLEAGQAREMRLACQRQRLGPGANGSVLEVRDNAGTQYLIPIEVERLTASDEARSRAGLWIGVASVDRVSESHSGTLTTTKTDSKGEVLEVARTGVDTTPKPTRSAFPLRVLIHVDTNGTARLLREVTQLWRDGTTRRGSDGRQLVDRPGGYVLVTDPAKMGDFKGVSLRDGKLTGRRFSSAGFDFPGSGPGNADNFLPLSGSFAVSSNLTGTIAISEDFPTNPFKHRFHPDHDNLDARFVDFKAEAYAVTRAITFEFLANDPSQGGIAAPDFGYSHLAGIYRETVSGLHREPIQAVGTFRLKRISEVTELNPSPLQ